MTDLQALDAFLSSDESPENSMQLSDLDGFLTGIVCSPDVIMPSTWLPVAFGSPEVGAPPEIIELVMERYNEIVAGLNTETPILEPVFWQTKEGTVIAMDWCEGFMDAYALRSDSWDELMRTDEGRDWMFPIFAHLLDEDGNSLVGAQQDQIDALLDAAAEQIAVTVPNIFKFWQASSAQQRLN